jgi:hypothetical protein
MNRHAEKVVVPRTPAEAAAVDAGLDGALVTEYACPACGMAAEQLVPPPRHA